jgi:DNA-binding PadR family transcriptional regulator
MKAMRSEDLKSIILKMFGDNKFYGYEVHKQFASEGIEVEISRLYRILNEMLREGLLESYWGRSRLGPRRRIYQLGRKGKEELNKILLDAINTLHNFYGKYLINLPPKVNAFDQICNPLVNALKEHATIAYISLQQSGMHERLIQTFLDKIPQGKFYFVKPDSVEMDLKLNRVVFLDGGSNNIPLRDGYLDLLLVVEVPKKQLLVKSLKEWHRVLKRNGRLAILSPTVLLREYKDPLTIGEFIEKYEHGTRENGEQMTKEFLQGCLKKFFNTVDERQIAHMTLFVASGPCSFRE